MKSNGKPTLNIYRVILLATTSILYTYSIICVTGVVVILVVFAVRRELNIFEGITFENILTIITGVVIFLPIHKIRKYLLEN
jgi:hypothetical protein